MKKILAVIPLGALCLAHGVFQGDAFAAELIVKDCQGTARVTEQVEQNSSNSVKVKVNDTKGAPLDGTFVRMINTTTQDKKVAIAKAGNALFEAVTPGIWNICDKSNYELTDVAVITPEQAGSVNKVAVIGGGIAAAGLATGIALSGGDDNNDDSTAGSLPSNPGGSTGSGGSLGTGESAGGSRSTNTARPGGSKGNGNNGPRPLDDEECSTDDVPDPISGYN